MADRELTVDVQPFGPTATQLADLGRRLLRNEAVSRLLRRHKHRLVGIEVIDQDRGDRKSGRPREPDSFRAKIYDYNTHRTVVVEGSIRDPAQVTVSESGEQPPVTSEEFRE